MKKAKSTDVRIRNPRNKNQTKQKEGWEKNEIKEEEEKKGLTSMRSKKVAWTTLTKSASQALRSSSPAEEARSSDLGASTCFLQYSMTLERILLVTFGRGIPLSAQSSSIMCLIVWDSRATASSTSKVSPSELFRIIFLPDAIASEISSAVTAMGRGRQRIGIEKEERERKDKGTDGET